MTTIAGNFQLKIEQYIEGKWVKIMHMTAATQEALVKLSRNVANQIQTDEYCAFTDEEGYSMIADKTLGPIRVVPRS